MTELHMRPDVRPFLDTMAANPHPQLKNQLIAMIRQTSPDQMPSSDRQPAAFSGEVRDNKPFENDLRDSITERWNPGSSYFSAIRRNPWFYNRENSVQFPSAWVTKSA